ncbi:nodulation protein NfeD [candidate division KSB1 bacterium]|nr:nodulation protein NfeD [candidate division KSB1 bacterium]
MKKCYSNIMKSPIFIIISGLIVLITIIFPTILSANSDSLVYVIEIHGVIEKGLSSIVERQLELAEEAGAFAVIFDVNTPGGLVDAAGEIRDHIFNTKLKTYAYVNREAISAGALISLSCEKVIMVPGSSIGAVTPVGMDGTKAPEKAVSYVRSIMRAIAEKRGRDPKIAEAMVDEEIEIEGIVEKGKLLTLTAEEAHKLKYADFVIEGLPNVLKAIGLPNAQIIRPKANWSENMVRFLVNPYISSLLLTIGLIGLIYEITTQGWGISGTLAVIALALFFGSHYLINLANIIEILVFVAGLILLAIEIFFTPGFGLLGVLGILAIFGSIIFSLIGDLPDVTTGELFGAFKTLALSLLLTVGAAIPLIKFVPKTKAWNRLILNTQQKSTEGFRSTSEENELLLGKEGTTLTFLRPAGTAIIDSKRVDVVSDGELIEKNTRIKVIKVEGNRVVVQKS